AVKALKDTVTKEIESSLKSQTSDLKTVYSSGLAFRDPESSAKPDDPAQSFKVSLTGSVKTVAIKQGDLHGLIKGFVEKTGEFTVFPDKLSITFDKVKFNEA